MMKKGQPAAAKSTNTVNLHRILAAKPEKVYRAFLDADAVAKWLPPNGFTCKVHHMEAKVGGTFKMSFANFTTGRASLVWWRIPRAHAARADLLYGQVR